MPLADDPASHGRRPHVFLHIGAMKTGTTYLQELFRANVERLAEVGVLYPHDEEMNQNIAVRAMMARFASDSPTSDDSMWDRMVARILAHPGEAALVSMEFLSYADHKLAQNIVGSFEDAEVTIILTVRDLAATLPGQWQTACRNGNSGKLAGLVRGLARLMDEGEEAKGPAVKLLRRTQQISRMLDVWVPLVGPEQVHVITVPARSADPRQLWERFAGVLGVAPQTCLEAELGTNPSIGLASTELLRRLNELTAEERTDIHAKLEKRYLGHRILTARRAQEPGIGLNRRGRRLAARMNRQTLAAISHWGVHLHGDESELPVEPDLEDAPKAVPSPSAQQLLEAAATATEGLVVMQRRLEQELDGTAVAQPEPSTQRRAALESEDPVERAVAGVAEHLARCALLAEAVPTYEEALDEVIT